MDTRDFLYGLERFGIKLGLDNIRALLASLGNPHLRLPAVHVAGTNGKGSVLAMLDAMLRAAGYDTGRFTSPHLLHANERFLHNGRPIDDAQLDALVERIRPAVLELEPSPTFFEAVTAIALDWFADLRVDCALVEVGMGGRFDSTNVIEPIATAITNIDLEHTQFLGDTLEKIAFEKAGIIKPGVPVIVSETRPGPRAVILDRARELQAPALLLDRDFSFSAEGDAFDLRFACDGPGGPIGPVRLGLAGRYQGPNAAVATALAATLRPRFPRLTPDAVAQGLRDARWPCRLERVLERPLVIIDVAHNHAGAAKLAAELPRCLVVMAVSSDKAAGEMIAALAPIAERFILTRFDNPRSLAVSDLANAAGAHPHDTAPDLESALARAFDLSGRETPIVVTGSIFTAGEARDILIRRYNAPPLLF